MTERMTPNARRAVAAGTRYRGALVWLAVAMVAAVFATLVIVVVLLMQSGTRGKENHEVLTSVQKITRQQQDVIRVLVGEVDALQANSQNHASEQKKLLTQLQVIVRREDGQIRQYLLQLIRAVEDGQPLSSVPQPTVTVTQPRPRPTPSATHRSSKPPKPRPTRTATCIALPAPLPPVCIPN